MKFVGSFEKRGTLPQFSNTRSRCRDAQDASNSLRAARAICGSFVAMTFAAALLGGQAQAQERAVPAPGQEVAHFAWADVLRVDPVYDDAAPVAAHEECYEEQVIDPAPAEASDAGKRTSATFIGAIIGGIIGNHFGKGNGRTATTAAGAVVGGAVGNNVAANQDNSNAGSAPKYTTQRRCHQVGGGGQRHVIAYDVEYRYRGDVYSSRLNYDPGDRIRVRVSVTPAE